MVGNSEDIQSDINRVLWKVFEYQFTSISSLEDKASRFLSFSMIINSLLAGYVGVVFLLAQPRITAVSPILNSTLFLAIACLIIAILCLLITDIVAAKSLSPKKMALPITENVDDMRSLHTSFNGLSEWEIHHREMLIDAIKKNRPLEETLGKNVRLMGVLITLAAVFFIVFIFLTFVFTLTSAYVMDPPA